MRWLPGWVVSLWDPEISGPAECQHLAAKTPDSPETPPPLSPGKDPRGSLDKTGTNQMHHVKIYKELWLSLILLRLCKNLQSVAEKYLIRLIFIDQRCFFPTSLFTIPLGQLHTDGHVVPTVGNSAGSLQVVWSPACWLHYFGCFLKSQNYVLWRHISV